MAPAHGSTPSWSIGIAERPESARPVGGNGATRINEFIDARNAHTGAIARTDLAGSTAVVPTGSSYTFVSADASKCVKTRRLFLRRASPAKHRRASKRLDARL